MNNFRSRVTPYEDNPYKKTTQKKNDETPNNKNYKQQTLTSNTRNETKTNNSKWNKQDKKYALPAEGYIYKTKMETENKEKLDEAIRKIRGNKELRFIPTEEYIQYKDKIVEQNERRRRKMDGVEDLNIIGDDLKMGKNWPNDRKKVRITFQNVGGICPKDNLYEAHIYHQDFLAIQSDITCFTELNINLNNARSRNDI